MNEGREIPNNKAGNSDIADVSISRTQLLEALHREWYFKYYLCPEGESQEGYLKRCLIGEGFLNAMKVIAGLYQC